MKFIGVHDGIMLIDILMTSHLSGLNSIDQVDSHSSSLCRSDCKVSESDLELIVRYTIVSSANRRALLLRESGRSLLEKVP